MLALTSINFFWYKIFFTAYVLCYLILVQLSEQKEKQYELTNSPKSNKVTEKVTILYMLCLYMCSLTHTNGTEIMHSRDVQCKSEESP